jgi:NADH-quinone oxidoreductase subunit H
VSQELPGAVAVACIVMMTGSLRVEEIVLAQGGWPWDWYAFRSPITLVLFALYVGTALAHAPAARDPLEGDDDRSREQSASGTRALLLAFAERVNVVMTGAIAASLFLGGWQVPGPSAGAQEAHVGLQALGAVLFVLKAWAVMAMIAWGRWAMPRLLERQKLALSWVWLVPAALTSFLLSAAWIAWSPGRTAQLAMGVGMCAVCGAAVARFAARAAFHLRSQGAESGADAQARASLRLNPFL